MSELLNTRGSRADFRKQLLATVSAAVLLAGACEPNLAKADDQAIARPVLWIELGGQLDHLDDSQQIFSPAFLASRSPIFEPSQPLEHMPLSSIDEDGSISFQPEDTRWILFASIRYGRSASTKDSTQNTSPHQFSLSPGRFVEEPFAEKFATTVVRNYESHILLDFQAGKDFGLGMFGQHGTSTLNLGVRYAQFSAASNINLKSDPDWHWNYKYVKQLHRTAAIGQIYHTNMAAAAAKRSFHGVGPSIAWNGSAPVVGNAQGSELTLDWGIQAAVLFGRQKARVHHQTTSLYHTYHDFNGGIRYLVYQNTPPDRQRSRTVTIPNVGGFAGATWRIEDFKVSAGYRADLFFGAMDGGIDTRKTENIGFYGPFASVSVGIGG